MTGNRVEELEAQMKELRATVSGLTDELVETKERLRLIEDHFGPELDEIIEGKSSRADARSSLSGAEATPEPASPQEETPDEAADEANAEEEEADDESAGTDDIIVA
ncbi:DUF7518 family protein [Halosegnis marinus]|uniref:Chromosome segregation protein SMC n=1 Tax=Halosegnis marinus TaxID=3034023 RepID=A0ABD5ZRE6_9EURY|nr:bZIP transcription factor [Halosegnis sp. DT85]